jgi:hypothetical protein
MVLKRNSYEDMFRAHGGKKQLVKPRGRRDKALQININKNSVLECGLDMCF